MKCEYCGQKLSTAKHRSAEQNARFHKMISAVHSHWPESHEHQYADKDHLRYWLEMKAGFFDIAYTVEIGNMDPRAIITFANGLSKAYEEFAIVKQVDDQIIIYTARSIAFDKLSHKRATELFDKVDAVIYEETGTSGTDYLNEENYNA